MKGTDPAEPHGVVVVDKPGGMTSHDVVARVRRILGTRRVGHAGTLDPMATGVLVVLVGEATKLAPYLTADDKSYTALVELGRATDTLDADGRTTATAEVPSWLRDEIRQTKWESLASFCGLAGAACPRLTAALAAETARTEQIPPAYSAIQVDGRRSYDRARAGEQVDLAPRPVAVRSLVLELGLACDPPETSSLLLRLTVSKGYYVRSLARDLGEALGVPAHLGSLKRVSSGAFALDDDAISLEDDADWIRRALIPPAEAAARALPVGRLGEEGAARARQGKRLVDGDFTEVPPVGDASAWLDPSGRLVAIGARAPADAAGGGSTFVLHRGFVT